MNDKIKKALVKVGTLCAENDIPFMLTGTTSFKLLGLPVEPADIDIITPSLTSRERELFSGLQKLTDDAIPNGYNQECYTLYLQGVKINVMPIGPEFETLEDDTIHKPLIVSVGSAEMAASIPIAPISFSMRKKLSLKREKDRIFVLNLIKKLCELCDLQK